MPKVSRLQVNPRHLGFFLNNFWNLITLLENKDQVKTFLKDLLTHTEMKMFAKRIQIAKMLLDGYSYQEIKSYVKVTDPTIAKISNILAVDGTGFKNAISYLSKIESTIEKKRMEEVSVFDRPGLHRFPKTLATEVTKVYKARKKKLSAMEDIST